MADTKMLPVAVPPHRFTVEDYYRMVETGILREDSRVELVEGEVLTLPLPGPRHSGIVDRINGILVRAVGDAAIVRVQNPLRIDDYSEPVPDLTLLRPRQDSYTQSYPVPSDVMLLIEVSDASLSYDRSRKLVLYAQARIPEYWIVNLRRNVIEVCRSPSEAGYEQKEELAAGTRLAPAALPDAELEVSDILR